MHTGGGNHVAIQRHYEGVGSKLKDRGGGKGEGGALYPGPVPRPLGQAPAEPCTG